MAIFCSCGRGLNEFWIVWNGPCRGWQVADRPVNSGRQEPVYAGTLAEAAFAIHHRPAVLHHDFVVAGPTFGGQRTFGHGGRLRQTAQAGRGAGPTPDAA